MKTILAYGDSLTYGANPVPGGARHAYEDRWPTALERGLGGGARVIAEGLGGRTTVSDDWYAAADRNGGRILPTLLESHTPLDLVIIMLGTNDLKPAICGSAIEASFGMRRLVEIAIALATRPDIIVLDEPAAGVPTTQSEAIFERIAALPRDLTLLFVEHDMNLVFRFAERITVLAEGAIMTEGTPAEISKDERVREVYLGRGGHHAAA